MNLALHILIMSISFNEQGHARAPSSVQHCQAYTSALCTCTRFRAWSWEKHVGLASRKASRLVSLRGGIWHIAKSHPVIGSPLLALQHLAAGVQRGGVYGAAGHVVVEEESVPAAGRDGDARARWVSERHGLRGGERAVGRGEGCLAAIFDVIQVVEG
eukprot:676439-Pleurochrysis_carterae.AAC.2